MKKKLISILLFSAVSISSIISVNAVDFNNAKNIQQIQEALNSAGYDCGIPDGVVGPTTSSAIERYRADHNLEGSGINQDLADSLKENGAIFFFSATAEELKEVTKLQGDLLPKIKALTKEINAYAGGDMRIGVGNYSNVNGVITFDAKYEPNDNTILLYNCAYTSDTSWTINYTTG